MALWSPEPLSPGLATVVSVVSAGPEAIECWFVEDAGGGGLSKKPATLLLRHGPRGPPPRPDLDPKLYFKVDGESSGLTCICRLLLAHAGTLGLSFPFCKYVWMLSKSFTTLLVCAFRPVCSQHISSPGYRYTLFGSADPAGMLVAAFRRYPAGASAPHCEMSRFIPFPASAKWARSLSPEQNCPRALDGDWLLVSVSSTLFSLSSLLRPQPEPLREPVVITMATGSRREAREMDG